MKTTSLLTFFLCLFGTTNFAQTGNFGIGTATPTTKLDIAGAITNRQGADLTVSPTSVTMPTALTNSQFRLVGSPIGNFTIIPPTKGADGVISLVYGARMIIVNNTSFYGVLNRFIVPSKQAVEFTWTNAGVDGWVVTSGALPQIATFECQTQQNGLLVTASPGTTQIMTNFGIGVNTIFGSSFNPVFDQLTLPAGTYIVQYSLELSVSTASCPAENFFRHSYFIDFPTQTASFRVHSNTVSNCGSVSNHSAQWVATITLTAPRTFTFSLGRGQAGNYSNGSPGSATGAVDLSTASRIIFQKIL